VHWNFSWRLHSHRRRQVRGVRRRGEKRKMEERERGEERRRGGER
jgi:hypothetical protein